MADLFASGRIVDLIIGFMALEALALFTYRVFFRGGIPARGILTLLLPGLALLLALRGALVGTSWIIIAAWLIASLVAHLVDLRSRLRAGQAETISARAPIASDGFSGEQRERRQEGNFRRSG